MNDSQTPPPSDDPENGDEDIKADATAAHDEGESEEGKSGEGEAGAVGQVGVEVSEGFYAYMSSIGASVSQVSSVLKAWRHLQGKGLIQALKDFAGKKARASAHTEVEIKKDSDYGVLHNFFERIKSIRNTPTQEHTQKQEHVQKQQADVHRHKGPGQHGPKGPTF